MSPPLGDAHVAGAALNAIRSTRSANATSPCTLNSVSYENMASTTAHSSVPRDGSLAWAASHSVSSAQNMPLGIPYLSSMLCILSRDNVASVALPVCKYNTPELFSACALLTPWLPASPVKLTNHDSQSDPCACARSVSVHSMSSASFVCSSSHCSDRLKSIHLCADHDDKGTLCIRSRADWQKFNMALVTSGNTEGSPSAHWESD
mmetsp:Transcript_32073/g.69260  ORF Transcript_32073/g.69260 Transcript_32073/m.69260 type:complete len:206 (+) Transcript_32073:909-1526(+)